MWFLLKFLSDFFLGLLLEDSLQSCYWDVSLFNFSGFTLDFSPIFVQFIFWSSYCDFSLELLLILFMEFFPVSFWGLLQTFSLVVSKISCIDPPKSLFLEIFPGLLPEFWNLYRELSRDFFNSCSRSTSRMFFQKIFSEYRNVRKKPDVILRNISGRPIGELSRGTSKEVLGGTLKTSKYPERGSTNEILGSSAELQKSS